MNISRFKPQLFNRTLAMAIALVCMASGSLIAQTSTGNIRGYVTRAGGGPVSDAQVIARMPPTNETRGTTTNASGYYYLGGLRPGEYQQTVRKGAAPPQTRPLTMRIGQTLDLNV